MRRPSLRVLLIEDNPDDALLIAEMLEAEPDRFRLEHATSLIEGLERLRFSDFDVVLLDMSLPDGRGMETVARSIEAAASIPIVVITGTDDRDLAARALHAGAQDYLIKGELDGRVLVRTIRHAIERQQILRQLRNAQRQANHLATHDRLTGLPNRELFFDRLEQAIARAARSRERLAVLFIDVDRFKFFNDEFGHAAGDDVLRQIAERLKSVTRRSDTVARLGGDEFTVILPGASEPPDPARVASNVLAQFREPLFVREERLHASVSIGIANYPDDGEDAEALVRRADLAMYAAKRAGGEKYRFCATQIEARATERLSLESRMKEALRLGEFRLHYQPQIDVREQRIYGVEALIRWEHPKLGRIEPARFIPLAERTGLIVPVGEWVLQEACRQVEAWNESASWSPLRVAVNLSSEQLRRGDFPTQVGRVLDESGLEPANLELEITESSLVEDTNGAVAALARLKKLGVKISIDDFGIGYSSLDLLRRLPADGLKIDQSFVRRVSTDRKGAQITDAIIAMASRMSLTLVAEGVETLDQMEFLTARNCPLMQGFFFSKPLPAAEFEALIHEESGVPSGY